MSRFFVTKKMINGSEITLSEEDSAHLARVLRAEVGEEITAIDESGIEYAAEITEISKKTVKAKITDFKKSAAEPKISVTLFQGLPKGAKMELIIQKCVEIGIDKIVPVSTARAVVKLNEEKGAGKEKRWNKIAEEAAKQSGRGKIPKVTAPISFDEAVKSANDFDMAIMPYELHEKADFKSYLRSHNPKSIAVYIGPEGGFEESEAELAKEQGIYPVSLGKRILRTETAPLSVLSVLMYEYDWE